MPYVRQPEELIPGKPLFYATAMTLNGVANGVLVESHEGRPTKVEGNPEHPGHAGRVRCLLAGLGAGTLRSRPLAGAHASRARFAVLGRFPGQLCGKRWRSRRPKNGAGIRILTETVTSPTHGGPVRAPSQKLYPGGQVASVGAGRAAQRARRGHAGIRPAGQHVLRPQQRRRGGFARCGFPGVRRRPACATRASSRRGAACSGGNTAMNRLYVVEPMPTPTGTQGRSSPAAARRRYRRVRLGAGHCARHAASGPTRAARIDDIYKWIGPHRARSAAQSPAPAW